jgi:uncharacterized delta-60 repeat protein
MRLRTLVPSFAMLAASLVGQGSPAVAAGSGAWDPTFGCAGTVVTRLSGAAAGGYFASIAATPDGSIVGAGGADDDVHVRLLVARYLPNGTPDPTFGTEGMAFVMLPSLRIRGTGVLVQPDGKIVAGGYTTDVSGHGSLLLARFDPAGTLDPTFGDGGIVQTQIGEAVRTGKMLLDGGGRIVITGATDTGATTSAFAARYLSDGSLDATYGSDGIVTFTAGGDTTSTSLAFRSDGELVLAGYVESDTGELLLVALLTSAGGLDPSFGSGAGWVTTSEPGTQVGTVARGVAVQTDDKIVTVGRTDEGLHGTSAFRLTRYDATGTLDSSFGGDGNLDVAFGAYVGGEGVAAMPGGDLYTWGTTMDPTGIARADIAVAHVHADGSLDTAFGVEGLRYASTQADTFAMAGMLDDQGRVVTSGSGVRDTIGLFRLDPAATGGHCPDAQVAWPEGPFQGNDTYGHPGPDGTVEVDVRKGRHVVVPLRAQNDSSVPADIAVYSGDGTTRFPVRFSSNGTNVTTRVFNGWEVWLDPGATRRVDMRIGDVSAPHGAVFRTTVRICSYFSPQVFDEVDVIVHVR